MLVITFLVLSNIVFAPSHPPPYPQDSSSYEGKPIDNSGKGSGEYYHEKGVIVYPYKGSEESTMMERFMKGKLSEDEMHALAKEKFGDKFSEEEFQQSMMESKEKMKRKEAFSFEHEGFEERYYIGPSYQGYSKEHMIFGRIFELIGDDIDPREIKQHCNDTNKVADIILSKLKEKIGDLQNMCKKFEEYESRCAESAKKGCSQIGTALVREDATETEKFDAIAFSCPVNADAIVQSCIRRNKFHMQQRIEQAAEHCAERFNFEGERLMHECDKFKQYQICDREKYINQCLYNLGVRKEDLDESGKIKQICPDYPVPSCGEGSKLREKVDSNGCVYYYCETIETCPTQIVPTCREGETLYKKIDERGCVFYYCESIKCPTDLQQCHDGSYAKRVPPSCNFETCPTIKCAEPIMPSCAAGTIAEKKIDEKGCVYYYCKTIECPQIQKPSCNADETLQVYYDNRGCVSSYQCIKHQTTCPEVSKPTCNEGRSLTTKYDDEGCVIGYECVSVTSNTSLTGITGNTVGVLATYNDFLNHCEKSWIEQERICSTIPDVCDKNTFIENCKEQERKNYEDFIAKIEQYCKTQTISEIKAAEHRCNRIEDDRKRCFEESTARCEQMKGMAQQCIEFVNEEMLRNFIIEETKKRCKFSDVLEDEHEIKKAEKAEIVLAILNTATEDDVDKLELFVDDLHEELKLQDTTVYKGIIDPNRFGDVKLLPFVVNAKLSSVRSSERAKEVKVKIVAKQKVEEAANKLVSLRDSDVPNEYLYIIEDKASDVLNVSDQLEDIEKKEEEKGFVYKIRLFLGLAKAAEQEEIKQLAESRVKLQGSIETLTKLIEEVPSDIAKAILKEQVENLKEQQVEIEVLIEVKEKKAKGLFGLFG